MCAATVTEERAFQIINTLSTAYLRYYVNGEASMLNYLDDNYIHTVFNDVAWTKEN